MPVFTPATLAPEIWKSDGPCGPAQVWRLSDAGGLTQFGVLIEVLPPGSRSSIAHWHAAEDELVHILSGTVDLHEGGRITPMHPGDTATFRAGDRVGHCLVNSSPAESRYLVIGTRAAVDIVTYPEDDRVLHRDRRTGRRDWTDHAGRPADDPYHRI
jgi:uncharacterized cupin superfamily protein